MKNGFKISWWCEYFEKYCIEIYFLHSILLKAKQKWLMSNTENKKHILFWNNQVYTRWKPTPWSCSKNSYSVPALKIIKKIKWLRKGKCFKGFLATGSQYLYSRLFHDDNFLLQLSPTVWEYSVFLPLTKIKSHSSKSIGDEECV